jgi:predicted MFS family arabinose efflux permease
VTSPAEHAPATRRRQSPAWRWQSARLALGTASALGFARFAYGLLVPAMRSELHWSLARAGAVTTANSLGYLLGAVATAAVARRLGEAGTFRLGMVLTAAAIGATETTGGSYLPLLLTRVAAGVAGAFVFISGGVIASRAAARARHAAPLAVYYSGAGLGIAFSGVVIPPLLGDHPGRWPLAWGVLAAAAAVATVVSWTATREGADGGAGAGPDGGAGAAPDGGAGAADEGKDTAARAGPDGGASAAPDGGTGGSVHVRSIARLWRVALVYLLFATGYIAYITFLSAYLVAREASVVEVALTWAVLGLGAIAAPALWSRPISAWGTTALAALLGILALAAALPLVSTAPAAVVGSAVGYGATFLGVPAAITSAIRRAMPPDDWTGALAAFTVVFAAGQTAGPYLAGALADRYGTGATLAWTAALCAAGALLSIVRFGSSRR